MCFTGLFSFEVLLAKLGVGVDGWAVWVDVIVGFGWRVSIALHSLYASFSHVEPHNGESHLELGVAYPSLVGGVEVGGSGEEESAADWLVGSDGLVAVMVGQSF